MDRSGCRTGNLVVFDPDPAKSRDEKVFRREGSAAVVAPSSGECKRYPPRCYDAPLSAPEEGTEPVDGPDFSKTELVPVIAQDAETGEVLMLAYMNAAAYAETLATRRVCYYSRSRRKLWRKGEESGNVQHLGRIYYDCDADAVLVKVEQVGGAACHEGYRSCFFREIDPDTGAAKVIAERVFDPAVVYRKRPWARS